MSEFPRTQIEHLSVPRMIVGTNWFLGFSHTSKARDDLIRSRMTRERIADVLEVFLSAGVDAVLGVAPDAGHLSDAVRDAEDRTGRKCLRMGTPHFDLSGTDEAEASIARTLDAFAAAGCDICLPHQQTTDALLDRRTRRIREMDRYAAMIRERGMVPGLSTHMPETPGYADAAGLDVATYIQIYNAVGFLMQVEVDWVHRVIWEADKPVICIKPLAAGRLLPLAGLGFAWATLRERDCVAVGTLTGDEAREVIDISRSVLERRGSPVELQTTRSKRSITARDGEGAS